LLSASLLARLLSPEDFGVFEIVSAVAGILLGVRSLGLAEATIQREGINHEQVSGLLWVNVLFGLALFIAMALVGPVLIYVYGDPRLGWLNALVGTTFVFSAFGVQHRALMTRHQRFSKLVAVDLVGLILGFLLALFGAMRGWGAWALAAQSVFTMLVVLAGLWIVMPWRPELTLRRGIGLGSLVRFGGYVTGSRLVAVLSLRLDSLLLGAFVATGTLGQYGRAAYLASLLQSMVVGPIEMPMRSYLSRVWSDDPETAAVQYVKYVRLLIAIPVIGGLLLSLVAPELVYLLLGPQWSEAGQLFSIMAIGGAVRILHSAVFTPFIGFGEGARLFRWSLWMLVGFAAIYAMAAPFGASGMSLGYLASSVLIVSTGLYEVAKTFGLRSQILTRDNLGLITICALVYLIGLVARVLVDYLSALQHIGDLARLVIIVSIPAVAHVVLLTFVSRSVVRDVQRVLRLWLGPNSGSLAGGGG
jgi:PST family polysaccharide transporter